MMTYARARLWLGISGVGTTVVIAAALILGGIPQSVFPLNETWQAADCIGLLTFIGGFLLLMLPFDLLGGYVLPQKFQRQSASLQTFARRWAFGVGLQSLLFFFTALLILAAGRVGGVAGALAVVTAIALLYLGIQSRLARLLTPGHWIAGGKELESVQQQLKQWGLKNVNLVVADHADPGFTGGVVGFPGREQVVIPRKWLQVLSETQLAVVVARRSQAIASGSRRRGIVVAFAWILVGFLFASLLPGGGVQSVAQLVTTFCGFTCWTFLGLLVLPTISRRASYAIDWQVTQQGVPVEMLRNTLSSLDPLQDDEPQRPALIETIFHPVPGLDNRKSPIQDSRFGAWHAARMTLFLSWSCLGLLSRAVHCNAGRTELWMMLPTD